MSSEIEEAIFLAAVEKHREDKWAVFLDDVCGEDARLRAQVQQLLRAHVEMGTEER